MSENFDLSGALDGVKPIPDEKISRITTMIRVDEPMEESDLPDRILFNLPPTGEGGNYQVVRYVRINSFPIEVRNIINTLQSYKLLLGEVTVGDTGFDYILQNVDELRSKILSLKEKLENP